MGKRIERFEDLIAWQKARTLTSSIYRITNDGAFSRDFGLKDQIRNASVSTIILRKVLNAFVLASSINSYPLPKVAVVK